MPDPRYFFCGIGGSGMLPLAMLLNARGFVVEGSDRSFDQGRLLDLARRIEAAGITLHPQDGSGLTGSDQALVMSSAVERQIPDVEAATAVGARKMIRAELLAELTNAAPVSCGIAGTSGKSTTTAMLAHILTGAGADPTVVNGAPMLNLRDASGAPVGWRAGREGPFVCEVDESDGSIALYNPSVGVILNVSEDHKTMAELEELFGGFAERSGRVVLGIDSEPVRAIASAIGPGKAVTCSLSGGADYMATGIRSGEKGLSFSVSRPSGANVEVSLPLVGRFNAANALAAIAAATLFGIDEEAAGGALATFLGSARRLQTVGRARDITVIDDFAHNPEKIEGSIGALTNHYGRVHILYQPHGYGPLRSFRSHYERAFAESLRGEDRLFVTEPVYFGGTVERTDDAQKLVEAVGAEGRRASYLEHRDLFLDALDAAGPGDAVVIMGARDDTLTAFAQSVLSVIEGGQG